MKTDMKYALGLAMLGALFFLPFLGGVHLFDWDEVNFAEVSREMLLSGDFMRISINFEPFWEKPPLFFWLQALSMRALGVGELAARLPNAICGIITLLVLFGIGKKLYHVRFGILWALTYMGSVLPFLYFKSGIIDPWLNLFVFLGLYFFILFFWKIEKVKKIYLNKNRWFYLVLSGLFIGLGILTKGPVALIIAGLVMAVYWVYQRFGLYVGIGHFLVFMLVACSVAAIWYGFFFIDQFEAFSRYQYRLFSTPDAGHKGFPGYHAVVLLIGCFPASIFALRAFFHMEQEALLHQQDFKIWMKFLFWSVLILFSVVQSKIVHYSSMCYFPLTFLAALTANQIIEKKLPFDGWLKAGVWIIGSLYFLIVLALPLASKDMERLKQLFAKDPFALANLEAQVDWDVWYVYVPAVLLFFLLFRASQHLSHNRAERGFRVLYVGMALFTMATLIAFIGRIEAYSQRAAVSFFSDKAGQDVYLATYGYKSYVHLFYGQPSYAGRACFQNSECTNRLLHEPLDKPAYIATKIHKAPELKDIPGLEEIGRQNGFVFFQRNPAAIK
jgi:4-amino-4-deoxy-L-arabinose transferase-like glycosyltransferase